jgi:16S rRNA U516 pseudouridylate synthase RsuA-like enzyme
MHEGRNRQIRRTFQALGYEVLRLHRTTFGPYEINDLPVGKIEVV